MHTDTRLSYVEVPPGKLHYGRNGKMILLLDGKESLSSGTNPAHQNCLPVLKEKVLQKQSNYFDS